MAFEKLKSHCEGENNSKLALGGGKKTRKIKQNSIKTITWKRKHNLEKDGEREKNKGK